MIGIFAQRALRVNFWPCHLAVTCPKDRIRPRADIKSRIQPPGIRLPTTSMEEFGHAILK